MLLEVVEHCFCFVVRCLVPWVGGIIISPDNFYDCLAELIDALLESAVASGVFVPLLSSGRKSSY